MEAAAAFQKPRQERILYGRRHGRVCYGISRMWESGLPDMVCAGDVPERKFYDINIDTKEYREIPIEFDLDELKEHQPGFMEESEWMQYCLNESAFNSLEDFLDGSITGEGFDRDRQIKAFSKVNADAEGACGENVYQFVRAKIRE